MTSAKRWKQLSGGSFFKFAEEGDTLEGIWQGTQAGKFGENGIVEMNGERKQFTLNAALKDLIRVPPGTEVRITYTGKQMSKSGNEFKAFEILVEDNVQVDDDEDVPF
jgi:hypothetical protein